MELERHNDDFRLDENGDNTDEHEIKLFDVIISKLQFKNKAEPFLVNVNSHDGDIFKITPKIKLDKDSANARFDQFS